MNIKAKLLFPVIAILLNTAVFSAETVSVNTLIESADRYSGEKVTISGEVIGDIMRDGENFWINVKDGELFIGVVISSEDKDKIQYLGRYKVRGDILKISGIYNLRCGKHWGERDIHAEEIEIIHRGYKEEEIIDIEKVIISVILALATLIFVLHSHRMNTRISNADRQN